MSKGKLKEPSYRAGLMLIGHMHAIGHVIGTSDSSVQNLEVAIVNYTMHAYDGCFMCSLIVSPLFLCVSVFA